MLSEEDILAVVASELSLADSSTYNGVGNVSLEESLALYLGQPDGLEIEGRSQVTSTDVADAIEWIMPQIMKSFTQNNEIVIFDSVYDGDEKQAEMESEYVYEVLMKQNDGFIILHQFVKDALMQRNGILKVYYAEKSKRKVSTWTGITEQQVQQLLSAEGVELKESSEYIDEKLTAMKQQEINGQIQQMQQQAQQMIQGGQQIPPEQMQMFQQKMQQLQEELEKPVMLYNVKVIVERKKGQIYVDPVPPEEFRLNAQHNSVNPDNARFTAHVVLKPVSDIIEEYGLTKDQTDELSEGSNFYDREYRFSMMNESVFYDRVDSGDESQRLIELAECFMKLDIDESGVSKLLKVTVAGGDSPTELIDIEEIDCMPWIATTAFLMSHKFQGLSITDRLKEIQEQKTILWRNMFDNIYLQNNQRNIVVEGQVNMDDLLVSRPGGVIRAKRIDAIMPLPTPQLGQDAYNMMDYLDRVRAGRSGVDPEGGATPQAIGDRVGSEGLDRLMNSKEELVGLIIRVIAETGIKPLCTKIRDLSVQHVDSVLDFKFRGVWQQINPSDWMDRTKCTVRVGTGTGNHNIQVAAVREVLMLQKEIKADPAQALINEKKTFDAIDDFCKFSGLNGATRYFMDPESPEGQANRKQIDQQMQQQQQQQQEQQKEMMALQQKLADAEMGKMQAQQVAVNAKAQSDNDKNALQAFKQKSDVEIDLLEQQLAENKNVTDLFGKDAELGQRKRESDQRTALELTRIEKDSEKEENANYEGNVESVNNG